MSLFEYLFENKFEKSLRIKQVHCEIKGNNITSTCKNIKEMLDFFQGLKIEELESIFNKYEYNKFKVGQLVKIKSEFYLIGQTFSNSSDFRNEKINYDLTISIA